MARKLVNNTVLTVRVSQKLILWLDLLAEHRAMDRSAYIRDLIRREAERAGIVEPINRRSQSETTRK